ncbi:sce7726 family protein [Halomonas saccharevitans]|uniref:Sce7726 family protein n=1 Tax=Halomonas saccharevitans TaxID=416872 RepID=A0ABU3NG09_9GAMM|nr:sce7726 family protein [Halomonas saccharevitans]MDT8880104.1 sce7726 family protein [Halomonas saccharevitans]
MTELEIKIILVKHIMEEHQEYTLGAEVPFQFGERRADIALLESGYLSAFEIKGSSDNVKRLGYQTESYKKFFDYCFIVCEKENLNEVRKSIPREFGIMLAENKKIIKVRKSKHFKMHDKLSLASTLSATKLRKLNSNNKSKSKSELCENLAKGKKVGEIRNISRMDFEEKYGVVSRILRQETTSTINADDIYTITKTPPSTLIKKTLTRS